MQNKIYSVVLFVQEEESQEIKQESFHFDCEKKSLRETHMPRNPDLVYIHMIWQLRDLL